jgi:hypothetical protein
LNVTISAKGELHDASNIGKLVEDWLESQYMLEIDNIGSPFISVIIIYSLKIVPRLVPSQIL